MAVAVAAAGAVTTNKKRNTQTGRNVTAVWPERTPEA